MRTELFMFFFFVVVFFFVFVFFFFLFFFYLFFCIKNYIGTQGEVCTMKGLCPPPPVVCAADRSGAMVPVLFLFCVAL